MFRRAFIGRLGGYADAGQGDVAVLAYETGESPSALTHDRNAMMRGNVSNTIDILGGPEIAIERAGSLSGEKYKYEVWSVLFPP